MKKSKTIIDEFHYHEIMDRTHVILCTIEDHLITHVGMTEEMKTLTDQAMNCLAHVYQMAGQKSFDLERKK